MMQFFLNVVLATFALKLVISQVNPYYMTDRSPYIGIVNDDNDLQDVELSTIFDEDTNNIKFSTLFIGVAVNSKVQQVGIQFGEAGTPLNYDDVKIESSSDDTSSYFGIYLSYQQLLDYAGQVSNFDINDVDEIIVSIPETKQTFTLNIIWIPWWNKQCCNDENQSNLPCSSRQCIVWSSWWWGPYIHYNYSPWPFNFYYPCFNKPWWYCYWFPKVKKCYLNAANTCDCQKQSWEYYPSDCNKHDCPTSVPTSIPTPKPTLPTFQPTPIPSSNNNQQCCPNDYVTSPDLCAQYKCLGTDAQYYTCKSQSVPGTNFYNCLCSALKPSCCQDITTQTICEESKCTSSTGITAFCKWDTQSFSKKCYCP